MPLWEELENLWNYPLANPFGCFGDNVVFFFDHGLTAKYKIVIC